jgi:microcystin-dependent protein
MAAENILLSDSVGNLSNIGFPKGMIVIWYGELAQIPRGWALCNGENNTPDLRGRFVMGVNPNDRRNTNFTARENKTIGGTETHTLTIAQMPSHSHTITEPDNYSCECGGGRCVCGYAQNRPTTTTGGGQPFPIIPPYYTLAYIMKL